MSNYLSRDEWVKPLARRYEDVTVSYDGQERRVRVRSLTERERSEFELSGLTKAGTWRPDGQLHMKCTLISLCVVDDQGNPVLSKDDVKALSEQDGGLTGAVYDACAELNGLRSRSAERIEKNSDAGESTETLAG